MPLYVISYDLRKQRNYEPLWKQLRDWQCVKLLESVWVGELRGPAPTIRDLLKAMMDADDGLAVLELGPSFDWATIRVIPAGEAWLQKRSP